MAKLEMEGDPGSIDLKQLQELRVEASKQSGELAEDFKLLSTHWWRKKPNLSLGIISMAT